jgi:hypothetical protein
VSADFDINVTLIFEADSERGAAEFLQELLDELERSEPRYRGHRGMRVEPIDEMFDRLVGVQP